MDARSSSSAGPSSEPVHMTTAPADEDEGRRSFVSAAQSPKSSGYQITFMSGQPQPTGGAGANRGQPCGETSPNIISRDNSNNHLDIKVAGMKSHDCPPEPDHPRVSWGRRRFKGKVLDSARTEGEKRPLTLLDLPVDILKDIFKEVRHTNDLTSLALSHTALHRLAIPHIYSRFDIVWPDTNSHSEPRSGVDALTYGLATLVMAEEIFARRSSDAKTASQSNRFNVNGHGLASETTVRKRRGNHYAQYTKKFSLGNGPPDWVQEYLITKEGGKMLGTLVSLAVARMRSLETFVWDMPTGILRDVWLSLSSLGDHDNCRLEKVWVRWHDNAASEPSHGMASAVPALNINLPPHGSTSSSSGTPVDGPRINTAALDRVEHPNFSVLPPLKSLSVLDIDELSYLDEMAVLVGRSVDKLTELRVGLAYHVLSRDWTMVWERESLQQIDHCFPELSSLTIGEKRLGGVLGVLVGHVRDIHKAKATPIATTTATEPTEAEHTSNMTGFSPATTIEERSVEGLPPVSNMSLPEFTSPTYPIASIDSLFSHSKPEPDFLVEQPPPSPTHGVPAPDLSSSKLHRPVILPIRSKLPGKMLRLENLELERVPLSIPVLHKTIDWRVLTSLTLLHCQNHDQLWKILRRAFAPTPKSPTYPQPRRPSHMLAKKPWRTSNVDADIEYTYSLRLKKVHTNTVSPHLIACLKETLAPNSLEVLFLQDSRTYSSPVTIEAIYRGPLRRHRLSLKKVLIDSSEKGSDGLPTLTINSSRWRRWMLTREILGFMCGGKMMALREIGVALDYRDWHFFLQNLPSIPHVRSLYIPFLADHVHGTNVDPRELAMQLLDIVALRPEVELCYMGIANKCFELLENHRDGDERPSSRHGSLMSGGSHDHVASEEDDDDEQQDDADDDDVEEEDEDDGDDDDENDDESTESDHDDDEFDNDTDTDSDEGELDNRDSAPIRLREILFYDDKVAIFKARHGRL